MRFILDAIKFILPDSVIKKIRPFGHGSLALAANFYYRMPSEQMIVVGVTGTAGKSSTIQLLAKILNYSGMKTGYITTVGFSNGDREDLNKHGLSMPGWFLLQKELRQMAENGCKCALIETTSEGLALNRHLGINFDGALVTNLSPAHLDAHGGFENYRKAKGKLFETVARARTKKFFERKFAGITMDHENAEFFWSFAIPNRFGISFEGKNNPDLDCYQGENFAEQDGISFDVRGVRFELNLAGRFNAYNALLAIACADFLGIGLEKSAKALKNVGQIPGRLEQIENNKGIRVFVDYAPEPAGMENVLKTLRSSTEKRLIHVFGSTGGHRDVAKRFEFGKISSTYADLIIITNDDVYDSDPEKIAADVQQGIQENQNKRVDLEVKKILDRRTAIKEALQIAETGDTVIFTGKGSEQFLVLPNNKRISWDDREVVKEYLQ